MKIHFMKSKLPIPLFFARHTWIVIEENGKKERWEVFQKKNNKEMGYIHKNLFGPDEGLNIIPCKKRPKWKSKEMFSIEGKIARKAANLIKNSHKKYSRKNTYILWPGPNSNTFTQWVINQFPEIKNKLPWNAFGKNYNKD